MIRSSLSLLNRVISKSSKNITTNLRYFTSTTTSTTTSNKNIINGGISTVSTPKFKTLTSSNVRGEKENLPFFKGEALLEGIKSDGTSLRWYKDVGYVYEAGLYFPTLDGRKLKTTGGHIVSVPNKELVIAMASEWHSIGKYIQLSRLPLNSTVFTCTDIKKEGRNKLIEEFMNHLATDPVCNRDKKDKKLAELQKRYYDPLLEFGSNYYGIPFFLSHGLDLSDHPPKLVKLIKNHLESLNNWELVCLQLIASSCKSFLLTLNLYYGNIRLDQLYSTIAIEEEYQSETWGRIPFGHDLAECETHNEISPPLFILRTLKPIPLPPKNK